MPFVDCPGENETIVYVRSLCGPTATPESLEICDAQRYTPSRTQQQSILFLYIY